MLKNNRGQLIIEYVLILVTCVALATILMKFTDINTGGVLFETWNKLLINIGADIST